jgi:hypothetical protein
VLEHATLGDSGASGRNRLCGWIVIRAFFRRARPGVGFARVLYGFPTAGLPRLKRSRKAQNRQENQG